MHKKSVLNKKCIAVFLIAIFGVPALHVTAQTKKQLTREEKEAARLETRERRLQLISYLDGIAEKAAVIEPPEDRVRILIEVSDAFWFLDKSRAIASFTRLFQSIDSMDSEAGAESNKFNYLRQAALARIARREPELAAKLTRSSPPQSPADKWANELNAMSTPHSETLMGVAISLLKTDLQQSVSLARLALADGMSQTSRIYLLQLRAIDQAAADSLLELSLKHAVTRNPARLFDALAFWDYAFQPGAFHFGPVSWPRSSEARSYEVSQSLKLAVIQFAVAAINQNIQLRLSTDDVKSPESRIRSAQLYSVIQQLLPAIDIYIPRAADALRAELTVLDQAIRTANQPSPSLRNLEATAEQTNSAIESLLYKAERSTGIERDELYLGAAYRLLFEGHFEKAASIASRIDDAETKNAITDAINFNWTGSLLASGNTAEALTLARTIRAQEPRLVALAKAGGVLAAKGEAVVAEEIFNESQTLARKLTPSPVVSAAVLNIALAQGDAVRAFEALSLAVSTINKTNSDRIDWYMLNSQVSATPLKVASLNRMPSSNGGLRSIQVTYPRLAGLFEVFSEAARKDLHQAMRVAQDLSSKGLSLAVQASVCRSSAERLAQEELE